MVIPGHQTKVSMRTSNDLSVYVVELCALFLVFEWVKDIAGRKVLICSDSASTLSSIKTESARAHQEILYEILLKTKFKAGASGKRNSIHVGTHTFRNASLCLQVCKQCS